MSEMTELEYWQNMAKLWEDKHKHLEECLKECRETNDLRASNSEDTTQTMVVAKLKLFALRTRIQEATNIALGRVKAAQIVLTSINQKTSEDSYADGYKKGLSEGTARTILFLTQLYQKAIDTSEPLP